jgi:hypothetical protein
VRGSHEIHVAQYIVLETFRPSFNAEKRHLAEMKRSAEGG